MLYPAEPALLQLEPSNDEAWLDASARDLRALGFSLVGDHTAPLLGRVSGRLRTFLSSDGKVVAGANSTVSTPTLGSFSATSRDYAVGFWSVESNGRIVATSSSVTLMPPMPGTDIVRRRGANASVLLPMHLRRVEGRALRTFSGAADLQPESQKLLGRSQAERLARCAVKHTAARANDSARLHENARLLRHRKSLRHCP